MPSTTRRRGKQTPLTPIAVSCETLVNEHSNRIIKKIVYECPKCHTRLSGYAYMKEEFCHSCGKTLDWTRTIESVNDVLWMSIVVQFPLNEVGSINAHNELIQIVNRCARDGDFSGDSTDTQFVAAFMKTVMANNKKTQ